MAWRQQHQLRRPLCCWDLHGECHVQAIVGQLAVHNVSSNICGQVMLHTMNLCLQLARAVGVELLEKDDPVYEWRERLFKEFEETISKNGKYKETSA